MNTDFESLLIQYTNLLHEHGGPDSEAVKQYREQHAKNKLFIERSRKLDALFKLSRAL